MKDYELEKEKIWQLFQNIVFVDEEQQSPFNFDNEIENYLDEYDVTVSKCDIRIICLKPDKSEFN